MLVGLGLVLLEVKRPRMANFLPALVIAPLEGVLPPLLYAFIADTLGDVYYLSSGVLSACIAVPAIAVFWKS